MDPQDLEVQHVTMEFIQVHLFPKLPHMMDQVIFPLHFIKVNSQGHLHHRGVLTGMGWFYYTS